jgi:hypothetical protein
MKSIERSILHRGITEQNSGRHNSSIPDVAIINLQTAVKYVSLFGSVNSSKTSSLD